MNDNEFKPNKHLLREKLNLETGQIHWQELQRFFARGVLICVDAKLDLVEVATQLSENDCSSIDHWLQHHQLTRATDEHAMRWNQENTLFWSIVVAPWVLVQEVTQP